MSDTTKPREFTIIICTDFTGGQTFRKGDSIGLPIGTDANGNSLRYYAPVDRDCVIRHARIEIDLNRIGSQPGYASSNGDDEFKVWFRHSIDGPIVKDLLKRVLWAKPEV